MILVVSCCRHRFSEEEFVKPITSIMEKLGISYEIRRYYEKLRFSGYSGVIICGTALMDSDYLNYVDNLRKLTGYDGKVLGICAGYRILAKLYGGMLENIRKIGVYPVRTVRENPLVHSDSFQAYFLHIYALRKLNRYMELIALQDDEACIFKVVGREFYGVSFHPEVLNEEIIVNFLQL